MQLPDPMIEKAFRTFTIYLDSGETRVGYMRNASKGHEFAYERIHSKKPLMLPRRRGKVLYARVYKRIVLDHSNSNDIRYKETKDLVVMKKLSKKMFQKMTTRKNHPENPYTEIAMLQMLGDDKHAISMNEVLEDDNYLYLIMPYFGEDILWNTLKEGISDSLLRLQERAMVHNLIYLKKHQVIWRDISLENMIVCRGQAENCNELDDWQHGCCCCPLIDPAMALVVLDNNSSSSPSCGKLPYMSPEEVADEKPLSFPVDVWATGIAFFTMWTRGQRLYDYPGDISWKYFLRDGGIENDDTVDRHEIVVTGGVSIDDIYRSTLRSRIRAVQSLRPLQRNLLANMLRLNPHERMAAEDILQHKWFSGKKSH